MPCLDEWHEYERPGSLFVPVTGAFKVNRSVAQGLANNSLCNMNGLDSIERNGNFFLLKNSSGHHQLILLDIDLKVAECKQCACKGDQPCKNHKNENRDRKSVV